MTLLVAFLSGITTKTSIRWENLPLSARVFRNNTNRWPGLGTAATEARRNLTYGVELTIPLRWANSKAAQFINFACDWMVMVLISLITRGTEVQQITSIFTNLSLLTKGIRSCIGVWVDGVVLLGSGLRSFLKEDVGFQRSHCCLRCC